MNLQYQLQHNLIIMKKNAKNKQPPGTDSKQSEDAEQFPGYPLYPSSEDIMNRGKRIDVDVNVASENISRTKNSAPESSIEKSGPSDLTKDDFQALASEELHGDGDDEILANRTWPVDFAGEDLDVPGSEEDDAQEAVGSEDEENNSYSIGGDRHDDLEEDHS
jgi:hypothetical protein